MRSNSASVCCSSAARTLRSPSRRAAFTAPSATWIRSSARRGLARRGLNRQIGFQLRLALRGARHFQLGLGRGTRRFGLARIEHDQGTIGDLRGDIGVGRGRGMRGPRAFGFKRERFAGSRVGELAAVADTRRAVERGLARVLFRDGPRGGDRFHRCFARGLGRKLGARGIRPVPLEREDGGALFARRSERIPTRLLIPCARPRRMSSRS